MASGTDDLSALLNRARANAPDRVCIEIPDGRRWFFDEVHDWAGRFATVLREAGAVRGDRVAVQVEKSPWALMVYLACVRCGLVYLPLNPAYTPAEIEYYVADAEPRIVVCDPGSVAGFCSVRDRHAMHFEVLTLDVDGVGDLTSRAATARPAPAELNSGADLAAILYTSGTTGKPKGVMLTHGNLASNALALVRAWRFTAADTLLHVLPLFHVHGLFIAGHAALVSGARILMQPRFDAGGAIALFARSTVLMGVPTHYIRLLQEPALDATACATMRVFISGSAPLTTQTWESFRARTGQRILERYGMTETIINTTNPIDGERNPGSVGRPLPGLELRIADATDQGCAPGSVGQVQVRGPNVFAGYWRKPDQTRADFTADGFFRTGDLGRLDEHGYLWLVGRAKDLVISGGMNVYPPEIERVLDDLPGVGESAVFGLPDADLGETVCAVIVPEDPSTPPDPAALQAAARARLAGYKIPRCTWIVDSLPRNTLGKVQKNVLRDLFRDRR